jgi:hypothetical protein
VKAFPGLTKLKKLAQGKSDASGWNKHINKFQKRIANKVLRRMLRRNIDNG